MCVYVYIYIYRIYGLHKQHSPVLFYVRGFILFARHPRDTAAVYFNVKVSVEKKNRFVFLLLL